MWNTPEMRLLLLLQIDWIGKKKVYFEEELWHLQQEEVKMTAFFFNSQDWKDKRSKRDEIRNVMRYLVELQVNQEKLEEKQVIKK